MKNQMLRGFLLVGLYLFPAMTGAAPSMVVDTHQTQQMQKAQSTLDGAIRSGAYLEAPFALSVAKHFLNLAKNEGTDLEDQRQYLQNAEWYAKKARQKAKRHKFLTYSSEYLEEPRTPVGYHQIRKELNDIHDRFFSFTPQLAKYVLPEVGAGVYVDLQRLNEWINEEASPSELRHELAMLGHELKILESYTPQAVRFKTGSSELRDEEQPILRFVQMTLIESPDISVAIAGHTDLRGSSQNNLDLSLARAETIKSWLTSHGVKSDRLVAMGFGEGMPIALDEKKSAQMVNRRVEFWGAIR